MGRRPLTYAQAGVDMSAGELALDRVRARAAASWRPEVLAGVGSGTGLVAIPAGYEEPVLVMSTDGVGTKLLVAQALRRHATVGIDLVALVADDVAVAGAEPLAICVYLAVGRTDPALIDEITAGVVEGCQAVGCALVGAEVAEHPDALRAGEYDLAGFCGGVVERKQVVTGERIAVGDVLIGLTSPGLRSNGYALARRVLFDTAGLSLYEPLPGTDRTVGEELLLPSVIYTPAVRALRDAVDVHGLAHITGGGLPTNLARILPPDCDAVLHTEGWTPPAVFTTIAALGPVEPDEMFRTFNMGIGVVAAVPAQASEVAIAALREAGQAARRIGEVAIGAGRVTLE